MNLDTTKTEIIEDNGIKFIVLLLAKLNRKPQHSPLIKVQDPFLPPFEPGLFITELSETHRLIFNKFQVCKDHVLVVTTEFERQEQPLNYADISAVVKTMLSLNAFMYFNKGSKSGASQPHKHMQLIPFESMYTKNLPVEEVALKQYESERLRLFQLKQFAKFRHVVGILDYGRESFE